MWRCVRLLRFKCAAAHGTDFLSNVITSELFSYTYLLSLGSLLLSQAKGVVVVVVLVVVGEYGNVLGEECSHVTATQLSTLTLQFTTQTVMSQMAEQLWNRAIN